MSDPVFPAGSGGFLSPKFVCVVRLVKYVFSAAREPDAWCGALQLPTNFAARLVVGNCGTSTTLAND